MHEIGLLLNNVIQSVRKINDLENMFVGVLK